MSTRLLVATGALLALALSGCGGSDGGGSSTGTPSPSASPSASGSASGSPSGSATPANPASAAVPDQSGVLDTLPGSADGRCVDAGDRAAVRSGGLAVTQLDLARRQWTPSSRSVRLVFVPQHADKAVRLSVTGSGPGSFTAQADRASDTEDNRYFLLNATVPAAGTWTIRATSGPDTGCWTVTFG